MSDNIFVIWRKLLLIIVSELIGNPLGYALVGAVNRLSGRRLATVFMFYPATPRYVSAVTFPWYAGRARWQPRFAGIYSPGPGMWGLVLAVSTLEEELVDDGNSARLRSIVDSLERVRRLVGADAVALAGILPSVLRRRGIATSGREREQTAIIVEQAIRITLEREGFAPEDPVILLGGAGFIGGAVYARLCERCCNPLIVVDASVAADGEQMLAALDAWRGQPALLVNVSRKAVLETLVEHLWPQVVILNEVFPEAARATRERLAQKGITYLHLSGLRGFALPRIPRPYADAIPCCALARADDEDLRDRIVIRQLQG